MFNAEMTTQVVFQRFLKSGLGGKPDKLSGQELQKE